MDNRQTTPHKEGQQSQEVAAPFSVSACFIFNLPTELFIYEIFRYLSYRDLAAVRGTCKTLSALARMPYDKKPFYFFKIPLPTASTLLDAVSKGDEDVLIKIIRFDPHLLLSRANWVDVGQRHFAAITAFEYAMWSLDRPMWDRMLDALPRGVTGDEIRAALCLQAEKMLTQGLTYQCAGRAISNEKYFDCGALLTAYETFLNTYLRYKNEKTIPEHWDELDALWFRIGAIQVDLPISVRRYLCRGLDGKGCLGVYIGAKRTTLQWDGDLQGLGVEFVVCRGDAEWAWAGSVRHGRQSCGEADYLAMRKFSEEMSEAHLEALMQRVGLLVPRVIEGTESCCVLA